TLYWVCGLVDRSLKSRFSQPCRTCTAACNRATSARNWRTSAIRYSVSVIAPVSAPHDKHDARCSTHKATPVSDNRERRSAMSPRGSSLSPPPQSLIDQGGRVVENVVVVEVDARRDDLVDAVEEVIVELDICGG